MLAAVVAARSGRTGEDGGGGGVGGGGAGGGSGAVVGQLARNVGKRNSCSRSRYFAPTAPFYITPYTAGAA